MIWIQCDWYYSFYMAAVVDIISRCGFSIHAHHINQPDKLTKQLVLYTAFTLFGPTRHSMARHKTASNNTTFTLVKLRACGTNTTNHTYFVYSHEQQWKRVFTSYGVVTGISVASLLLMIQDNRCGTKGDLI